jgi:hypothetical protein
MFSLDGLNRAEVLRLIFLSGEESVLEITDDRGWLLFSDGSEQYIGKIVYTDERPDRDHTQLSEHRFFYFSK